MYALLLVALLEHGEPMTLVDVAARFEVALVEQHRAEWEKKRAAHGAELASLSRALIVAFPPARPQGVALLDVGEHDNATLRQSSTNT